MSLSSPVVAEVTKVVADGDITAVHSNASSTTKSIFSSMVLLFCMHVSTINGIVSSFVVGDISILLEDGATFSVTRSVAILIKGRCYITKFTFHRKLTNATQFCIQVFSYHYYVLPCSPGSRVGWKLSVVHRC